MKSVLAGVVLFCLAGGAFGASSDRYVLLVPERYTLVQLGADVSALCDIPLITYDAMGEDGGVRLFSWSPTLRGWRPLDLESLGANVGEGRLGTVLFVGREADMPSALTAELTGTPVARINTLNVAQVANALHGHLDFSKRQWKQLAGKHGLTLKDRNERRRKLGRYGAMGGLPEVEEIVEVPSAAGPVRIMGAQVEEVVIDEAEPVLSVEDEVEEAEIEMAVEPVAVEAPVVVKPAGEPATVEIEPIEKGVEVEVAAPVEEEAVEAEVEPEPEALVVEAEEITDDAEEHETVVEDPDGPLGPELPVK